MGNCRVPSMATDQSQLELLASEAGLCQGENSHIPIPAGIALVTFVTFPRTMSQTQSQLGLLRGGPGSCRWVQPQTNPSWDCSRHICDVPTSYCHRPNPSWDCFEGDAAYAGEYSHRPIPAGIALVTFVTFPRTMSQTQSQLGLLRGGPGLCRWIQPQTNPSWDCSRHICDVPTSYCHRPNPCWDCFEGDAAYP